MKSISFNLGIMIILGLLFASVVSAQGLQGAATELAKGSPITSTQQIFNILNSVVRYVYVIFFIVAVMFILFAAFSFLTAGGDTEKVKSARNQVLWAVVAIAIALLSVGASAIITNFLGNPSAGAATGPTGGNGTYEGGWLPEWSQD